MSFSFSSSSPGPISTPTPISVPTPAPASAPTPEVSGLGPPDASTTALSDVVDDPSLPDSESDSGHLLSASPDGLADPYGSFQGGWNLGSQEVDPYTNVTSVNGTIDPYVGRYIDPYTNTVPDGVNPNAYTGDQDVNPFTVSKDNILASTDLLAANGPIQSSTPELTADQARKLVAESTPVDRVTLDGKDYARFLVDKDGVPTYVYYRDSPQSEPSPSPTGQGQTPQAPQAAPAPPTAAAPSAAAPGPPAKTFSPPAPASPTAATVPREVDPSTVTGWAFDKPDPRLMQPVTNFDTGNRPLNYVVNKVLLPWRNAAAFVENIPLSIIIGVDDALKNSRVQMEYQATQDMLPLERALGLSMEVGPALDYLASSISSSQRLRSAVTAPAYWFVGAGGIGGGSIGSARSGTTALNAADELPTLGPALQSTVPSTAVQAALAVGGPRSSIPVGNLGAVGAATRKQGFRSLLTSIISDESHPLHGLLNAQGKLTSSTMRGANELSWFENPYIIEAGHFASAKGLAGAPDRLVMMSAYENRLLSATLEHPSIGGEMLESGQVLSIGGVPVDFRTANALVEYGLLNAQVFANAPLVIY